MFPLNVPNVLSVVRILLVPVLIVALLEKTGGGDLLAAAFQVAMVICLIAVHGHPLWLDLLIYATVLVTVLSGADYFFGLRRSLGARTPAQRQGT